MNKHFRYKLAALAAMLLLVGGGLVLGNRQVQTGSDTSQPAACCPEATDIKACCPEAADAKVCCPKGASGNIGTQKDCCDAKAVNNARCCPAEAQKCDKTRCAPPPGCCDK